MFPPAANNQQVVPATTGQATGATAPGDQGVHPSAPTGQAAGATAPGNQVVHPPASTGQDAGATAPGNQEVHLPVANEVMPALTGQVVVATAPGDQGVHRPAVNEQLVMPAPTRQALAATQNMLPVAADGLAWTFDGFEPAAAAAAVAAYPAYAATMRGFAASSADRRITPA